MNIIKERLINYLMDNPSLSEETDYLPDSERYKIYTEQVNAMYDREALEELHEILEPSELMDFIEALVSDIETERYRSDGLSDKLDTLYEGSHESDRIISQDEYKDYVRMGETLNSLIDLQDDIREDMDDKSNRGDVSEYTKNKIREFINMELT